MTEGPSHERSGDTGSSYGHRGRILLAEDDREMRALLSEALTQHGYAVVEVADGVGLMRQLSPIAGATSAAKFDLVVSDVRLPGHSGLDVFEGMVQNQDFPPIIFITAFGDKELHERAGRLGASVLDKPFDIGSLIKKVREMLSA